MLWYVILWVLGFVVLTTVLYKIVMIILTTIDFIKEWRGNWDD